MSGDQADGLGPLVLLNSGLFVILAAPLGTAWTEDAARTHRFLPRHGHKTPGGTPGVSGPTALARRQRLGRPLEV